MPACTHSKPQPLVPLELAYGAKADAIALNNQGMQAYLAGQVAEAKNFFGQAIKAAPDSGHDRRCSAKKRPAETGRFLMDR